MFFVSKTPTNKIDWTKDIRSRRDLEKSNQFLVWSNDLLDNNITVVKDILNNNVKDINTDLYLVVNELFKRYCIDNTTNGSILLNDEFINSLFNKQTKSKQHLSLSSSIDKDNDDSISFTIKKYIQFDNFLILSSSLSSMTKFKYIFHKFENSIDFELENPITMIILIIGPLNIKPSKTTEQVANSFSSALYNNNKLQYSLLNSNDSKDAIQSINQFLSEYSVNNNNFDSQLDIDQKISTNSSRFFNIYSILNCYHFLLNDIKKRSSYYIKDWKDGLNSIPSLLKTLSASVFLLFACLLPSIAFGVLHQTNTHGKINVVKTIISQGSSGLIFSILSGQPLLVLLSTAPIAIFINLIYMISDSNNIDFYQFYALVGLFNGIFLIIYSVTGLSRLMKYSSRFIEETFATFITIAFLYDGIKPIVELFIDHLYRCNDDQHGCNSVLPVFSLFLALITVWLSVKFSKIHHTSYFNSIIRGVISDYSLFLGLFLASIIRHTIFRPLNIVEFPNEIGTIDDIIHVPSSFSNLPTWSYFLAIGLGFLLSLLYFVDQNISSSLAASPNHNLKKWNGVHLDLFVVAIINIVLSFLSLPWVHGALPHSSLHVRSLSTIQTIINKENNHSKEIFIKVQETRLSGFFSHLLIFLSFFLTSNVLGYIPVPVLYGVFWFLGIGALIGNQFWERILLLITDQNLHPHSTISRQVKQSRVHLFTGIQIICLLLFCLISFYPNPYATAFFPLFITILIPIKNYILPKIFTSNELKVLDD